ncbi:KilA-N domain-containing protein [Kosakonia sp. ML.JS2a]|uniref:KilA-N domain-containing protein n=1 Tax=Kosakonia sp. ML.JS2a TaxID=2980557 RepID=UPI0021D97265|nr:KilA-N domain-containing protein [Kosakonia sp. ML.JS2a]UXY08997.1 KilA-N domain-containing protein [Kosakonia sp. ML.JS2a]
MNIVIFDVAVKQDKEGRFCLNDLHKAAGSERRNDPHDWLRLKQTSELVQELSDTGIPVTTIRGGKVQGTYVCKELVYAYAMWISAKFHLHVIRTFDAIAAKEQIRVSYRDTARLEYKPMTDAIKHERETQGKQISPHHFSNEADLINRLALGMTAAKFRVHHEIGKKEPIRDYLTPEQIHCITELQRANTVFISMGWDFEQRKEVLQGMFERNHRKPLIEEQHNLAA